MTGEDVEPTDAEAFRKGHDAGSAEERSRIRTILMHPEAKDREASAFDLAFGTDLSAVKATELLSSLAKRPTSGQRMGDQYKISSAVMVEDAHFYVDDDGNLIGDRRIP